MRQSQTLFGGVFLRRTCGFPGGTFQFAPMVGFSNQGLVRAEVHATYVDAPRVSLRGAFLGLFAFLVGVDGQCGGEYAQSFYLHRASHSHFVGQGFAQFADNSFGYAFRESRGHGDVFRQFARAGLSGHHHLGVGDWFARALQVGHFFHLVACGHCCVLLSFLSFVAKSFSLRSKVLLVAEKS